MMVNNYFLSHLFGYVPLWDTSERWNTLEQMEHYFNLKPKGFI